jgi:hypothetical protein
MEADSKMNGDWRSIADPILTETQEAVNKFTCSSAEILSAEGIVS